jgi:diacylglycerol kinase family enzyme
MRLHFVINPQAGKVRIRALRAALAAEFAGYPTTISGECPDLGTPEAQAEAARSGLIVVAAGGDGTVHRLLRKTAGTEVSLGVLPLGGANDFARRLGIPGDFRKACAILRQGCIQEIDLLRLNGRPLATGGGLGLAAAVSRRANIWKAGPWGRWAKLLGSWIYLQAALVEIARGWEPFEAELPEPGAAAEKGEGSARTCGRYAALLIASQARIGRWFRISSDDPPESAYHLCEVLAPPGRLGMLWICACLLFGLEPPARWLRRRDAAHVVIRLQSPAAFYADGEAVEVGSLFELSLCSRGLRVVVPAGAIQGGQLHAA